MTVYLEHEKADRIIKKFQDELKQIEDSSEPITFENTIQKYKDIYYNIKKEVNKYKSTTEFDDSNHCIWLTKQLSLIATEFLTSSSFRKKINTLLKNSNLSKDQKSICEEVLSLSPISNDEIDKELIELSNTFYNNFILAKKQYTEDDPWKVKEARNSNGKYDNSEIAKKILVLRLKKAKQHKFPCYADYLFDKTNTIMKSPGNARKLLCKELREKGLQVEADIKYLKEFYKDFLDETLENLNKYLSQYSEENNKPTITLPYIDVINKSFNLITKIYGITFSKAQTNEMGKDYDAWDFFVNNNKKGTLYLDIFARDNKPSVNANCNYFHCKDGFDTCVITCHLNKIFPNNINLWDLHFILHELGHFTFYVLNNGKNFNLPIEFSEFPSLFLEKFSNDEGIFLSDQSSKEEFNPNQKITNGHVGYVEAMKNLIDLDIHSVEDAHRYENLKELENKTYNDIFNNIVGKPIFKEFLDPEIITVTLLLKSFSKGQDATEYRYIVANYAAQFLYDEYRKDPTFIKQIKELWINPMIDNPLYKTLTSVDFYVK